MDSNKEQNQNDDSSARQRLIASKPLSSEEENYENILRPRTLDEFVGQEKTKTKLNIALEAAKKRKEPLEHILFYGPPGLGKTTLSNIVANEMGAKMFTTSGPALERAGDLIGILTSLDDGDVLFVDEIHRLATVIEEFIYPAMEEYKVDFVVDKGPYAKTLQLPLKRFTLIGSTTRAGFLSAPLRNRFGLFYHLDFYPPEDLKHIVTRSARILERDIDQTSAFEVAKRSRGTPRVANRLLRRVRDYADVKANGKIDLEIIGKALELEGIDEMGLDELDRKFLATIIRFYDGGPVGIEAIAATMNEESDTLEDMIEPFLLKIGFLKRTRRGRKASPRAYEHLKIDTSDGQRELF